MTTRRYDAAVWINFIFKKPLSSMLNAKSILCGVTVTKLQLENINLESFYIDHRESLNELKLFNHYTRTSNVTPCCSSNLTTEP